MYVPGKLSAPTECHPHGKQDVAPRDSRDVFRQPDLHGYRLFYVRPTSPRRHRMLHNSLHQLLLKIFKLLTKLEF
jgi:hypothetical protein